MAEKTEKPEAGEEDKGEIAQLLELLKKATPVLEHMMSMNSAKEPEAKTGDTEDPIKPDNKTSEVAGKVEDAEDPEKEEKATMDAKDFAKAVSAEVAKQLAAKPVVAAFDSKDFFRQVKLRDDLAGRLSHFVGVFDHSEMSADEVAAYGVEKLKIPHVSKGSEIAAVSAFLHGRAAPSQRINSLTAVATDSADSGDFVLKQLNAKEGA